MKIYIGPYKNWIGPYQIAEKILFWMDRDHDRVFALGTWLAQDREKNPTALSRLCNWIESKRVRSQRIHIDPWDTWNMDATLALIILPMLRQLKETKHGSPNVSDSDVPDHLKSTRAPARENEWDTDSFWHDRWNWVLDEMIFAFASVGSDWEDKYWITRPQLDLADYPEDAGQVATPVRWKTPGECDHQGRQAEQDRITNGFRLFGKYYQCLWD